MNFRSRWLVLVLCAALLPPAGVHGADAGGTRADLEKTRDRIRSLEAQRRDEARERAGLEKRLRQAEEAAAELRTGGEGRFKKKRGVLVVCDTGTVSHSCAEALQKAGLEGAFSLRGGLAAWQRENQPLVAGKVRA